ncbi:hypothetical protein WISP_113681 [Willisornis vidua]|uniref:C2H2-type domain-containing protein n=1 Tax=Willisornis vidua TaxID=1566151 RepID=A0ABQ9CUP3_9PASS|nr:hypothetical protein WISP_113681 [Willisornis vidua]
MAGQRAAGRDGGSAGTENAGNGGAGNGDTGNDSIGKEYAGNESTQNGDAGNESAGNGSAGEGSGSALPARPHICSFPGCYATFSKGWRLAAHLCRHTGEAKRSRPKRSLASRLSGYIPPKATPGKDAVVTERKTMDKLVKNEIPTVEILTLQ